MRCEAAALWERLTEAAGVDARDAVWQHPDLLPGASDLDEPAGFIDRVISDEPLARRADDSEESAGDEPDDDGRD